MASAPAAKAKAAEPARVKPKRRPPTPKRLQKKVLTLAQAADEYERTDDALKGLAKQVKTLEAEQEEAEEILLAHFAKTGNASYKGRIGWCWSSTRRIFDQDKLTKFLGAQVEKFKKDTESKRKLTRLVAPK
jgi:hypothetical protein